MIHKVKPKGRRENARFDGFVLFPLPFGVTLCPAGGELHLKVVQAVPYAV